MKTIIRLLGWFGFNVVDSNEHNKEVLELLKDNSKLRKDIDELVLNPDGEKAIMIGVFVSNRVVIEKTLWLGHETSSGLKGFIA